LPRSAPICGQELRAMLELLFKPDKRTIHFQKNKNSAKTKKKPSPLKQLSILFCAAKEKKR
jgi:hypothetical protein